MIKNVKLIFKCFRSYKKFAIITTFFMLFEALLECILPFVMSILVDVLKQNSIDIQNAGMNVFVEKLSYLNETLKFTWDVRIVDVMGILFMMSILSLLCGILGGRTAARASVGLSSNLRSDMYKKIQTFSFANIDKFSSASLLTRMTTDISNIQLSVQMLIRMVIRAPLMMIFSAIMAFISGGQLAWIFIILVPIIAIGFGLIMFFAMRIFRVVFRRYDKLNETVEENVTAIRVVKSFVREDYEKKKFADASDSISKSFIKAEKIVSLNNPILNTAIHTGNIIILGVGSYFIFKTETVQAWKYTLSVGQMSSLLTYGIQILMSLLFISMILVMFVMSIESMERICEVLREEPQIKNPENPLYEITNGDIEFNNVNFKYSQGAEKYTLENINLKIKSGQFVGVIGSTGSGKTTLVNLISRLYDVSEGEVKVSNHNVKEYDLTALRDNVAVVLQKNVLFSGSIKDNLKWGDLNASDEEVKRAAEIAQASSFIESFPEKYDTHIEQGGANVSGGQKQRLCIARALLKKPNILILDDSTSAVDTKTDKLIRHGLKEDLPHMTKIVIAQRISSIEDADLIIVMDDGKISATGTHDELMKTSMIYQEVYNTQSRVGGEE